MSNGRVIKVKVIASVIGIKCESKSHID